MKVLNFLRPENGLTEDPLYYLNFERFENKTDDFYFFMADFYKELYSGKYNDKPRFVLTLEEPNFCVGGNEVSSLHLMCDKIFTLCPYTAELFDRREFVFFPFNEEYIPKSFDKTIDIAYFGSFPNSVNWDSYMKNVVMKHKYVFGNYGSGNAANCTYMEKINHLSKSKISLVHGLCNVSPLMENAYRSFPLGDKNKAFDHINKGMLPQIKSRTFESAFSKSLILCQKDPWNVIEFFFEEGKDFIYFDDENDLSDKVNYILKNYEQFTDMIESAYVKACNNYTVSKFVERYLI
jgi:hypothetical protein